MGSTESNTLWTALHRTGLRSLSELSFPIRLVTSTADLLRQDWVFIQLNPNIFAPVGGIQFNGGPDSDTLHMAGGSAATFLSGNYNITGPDSGTITYNTTGGVVNVAVTGMELINDTTTSGTHTTTATGAGENVTIEPGPILPPVAGFVQGPVIVDGGDRDDHGFFSGGENQNGWLFIEQMVNFVHTYAFNVGGSGILSIGTSPGAAANAIDSVGAELGIAVTHVNDALIDTVDFADYRAIYVPSNSENTGGGITGSEIQRLFNRRAEIQGFVRSGGGLVALTEEDTAAPSGPFAWLEIPDPFQIVGFTTGGISDPLRKTAEAIAAGFTITDAELSNGVPYHNVFVGPPGFNGLDIFVKDDGPNNIVGDSDDRNVTLGQGAINQTIGGGPTTRIFGNFPTLQVGMKLALVVDSAGGSDNILVKGDVMTLDGLPAPLAITGATGNDTLSIIDSADLVGDSIFITNSLVSGLASFPIAYANIDILNVTATSGHDTLDSTFTPGSDLDTVRVSGWLGSEQFYLSTTDEAVGGLPTGIQSISLYGDAPGNPNPTDGIDIFGETPSDQTPGFMPPPGIRMIRPSVSTLIHVDGGRPTAIPLPPVGNQMGDTLNLDVSALGPPVLVATLGGNPSAPGVAQSIAAPPSHKTLTFIEIENIHHVDEGILSDVQMGDLYVRGSNGIDAVTFLATSDPNAARVRVNSYQNTHQITRHAVVYGRGGNDYIQLGNFNHPAEFYGEEGDDYLAGYLANDKLVGGAGRDRINASHGDNVVWGDRDPVEVGLPDTEPNRQLLSTAAPGSLYHPLAEVQYADILSSLDGLDVMYGGPGQDSMTLGGGNDHAFGGQGEDNLGLGSGDDRGYGGDGDDTINGSFGNDLASGGEGADIINGEVGNDVMIGGGGNDTVSGSEGSDMLFDGRVTYNLAGDTSSSAGDANDVAMQLLLADWVADLVVNGAFVNDHHGADNLRGNKGADTFSAGTLAEIIDFELGDTIL